MIFTNALVKQVIQDINTESEKTRRALAKRRHDIYKDGGKQFLIEQIRREFNEDAIREMRIAPINLLKKIVNKRASVYKKPPTRTAELDSDMALMDYYVKELDFNIKMQKLNRYYTLLSNSVAYIRPVGSEMKMDIIPSYLYSVVPNEMDQTKIDAHVFNTFVESMDVAAQANIDAATGVQSFSLEPGYAHDSAVATGALDTNMRRNYMFWSDQQQFTTDESGTPIVFGEEADFSNPIGRSAVINVAKDRDNEAWATQGEDLIDLTLALQLGWTDVLSIAKHQGFSILTIISEEEPKKLTIGVNRAIWLKATNDSPTPSISYTQATSPLSEYTALLMDLLKLMLSSNDMEPGSISNSGAQQFTSGFHQLIAMSDNIEAIEADKPAMAKAEDECWDVISRWHNYMFESGQLEPEARSLGKFSANFEPNVMFADAKPLDSEDEIINRVKTLRAEGLISRLDAIKRLNPGMTDEMAAAKLLEIDNEAKTRMLAFDANSAVVNEDPNNQDNQDGAVDDKAEGQSNLG